MADAPIPSQFAFSGFDLTGKVAFVTGGGSGLGKAIATGLHQAGATVVIGSRSAEKLSATAAEIGARCSTLSVDTCDRASVAGAFEHIDAAYGKLDILVNAAGILHRAKAEEETVESFEKVMKTNVTGVFSCCQLAAKRMQEQASGGCILNIASLTSFVALSDVTSYACSKAAVMQMTKQLASDWARYNIRVNAIAPGVFPTPINRAAITGTPRGDWMIKQTPMDRFGEPQELAGLAVYLCSPAASFTTGSVIPCDGGFLARGVGPTS